MISQAATVDLLVKKGKFEPHAALAITEAIDTAMTSSQIVTVPILDARLTELRADMRVATQELKSQIVCLEQKVDSRFEALEQKFDGKFEALEQKFEGKFEALEQKFDGKFEAFEEKYDSNFKVVEERRNELRASLEEKMEHMRVSLEKTIQSSIDRTKAELVRWVFATMLGSAAITVASAVVTSLMQHSH